MQYHRDVFSWKRKARKRTKRECNPVRSRRSRVARGWSGVGKWERVGGEFCEHGGGEVD